MGNMGFLEISKTVRLPHSFCALRDLSPLAKLTWPFLAQHNPDGYFVPSQDNLQNIADSIGMESFHVLEAIKELKEKSFLDEDEDGDIFFILHETLKGLWS